MWLGLTSNLYGSLCCSSFYVAWSRIRSVWVSMLCEFQYRLVSHPFCMGLYVVRVSMSLGLASVLYGSLCCPSFYFTWCHLRSILVFNVIRVSMSLGLTSIMYGSLCFPSFYVTWSHFRSVWVSMLSEFLCHLVSLPLCMVLYVFQVSMSFVLISVLWVSMFSEFLWHLISLPFCMGLYFVRFSMSLNFTSVLYVLLCCPSF